MRFKATGKFYLQQCRVSCYLFLPEYDTLDARKLADYLLVLFHQSKRFYAENVKPRNEKQNKVRKDQQIKMFNTKVTLPHTTSCVNILRGHRFNSRALLCLLWRKKPSLDRNVDSEKVNNFVQNEIIT